ncbi:hypothetical protein QZM42_33640 [Burkholderia vietnamiensis]|uniref:hypothetical protein n=1 Tax=Burkholderia vietnamiensis TaxID=60552 RepID=UPI00264DDBD1|nr:hypothetical protein [Burkholderia vietnamiensis]MDN7413471.1 hypothetical protein [Burkholderia vietnamiensis]
MASNDFLAFGGGGAANVIDQAAYAALAARLTGFQSGTAQSAQLNKVWRQSSIMAAVIAQFIVNQTGQNAVDDGTTATLLSNFATAVAVSARQNPVLADTGAANAYAVANLAAFSAYPTVSGLVIDVSIANANTGASTLNVDGLGAKPIYGLALQALQGGELVANGVACLLYIVAPTVNAGNGAWILMECAGGAQQVTAATQSRHAVQFGQVSGVVGGTRNLSMSVTAASATATLTADEIVVETALGGLRYCLANFNKTINLATTGAGGMDTGSAPVSGFVGIYAIYNPTTGASALLATNATAAKVPEVYAGGSMPSGYTASALVSVVPTNASGQITRITQRDRDVAIVNVPIISTSSGNATPTAFSTTAFPKNATKIKCYSSFTTGAAATVNAGVYADLAGSDQAIIGGTFTGAQGIAGTAEVLISTPQTIYYTLTASSGAPSWGLNLVRYSF